MQTARVGGVRTETCRAQRLRKWTPRRQEVLNADAAPGLPFYRALLDRRDEDSYVRAVICRPGGSGFFGIILTVAEQGLEVRRQFNFLRNFLRSGLPNCGSGVGYDDVPSCGAYTSVSTCG